MTPQADLIGHAEMIEHHATDLTLGQYLSCERAKRGISLEEMQKKTSIHLKVLHAMESDDPTNLPAPFFVKNFIKFYTETLGLDPQYALALYDKSATESGTNDQAPQKLPTEPLAEPLPAFSAKKIFSRLVIGLMLLGVGFIAWRNYQASSDIGTAAQETATHSPAPAANNAPADSNTPLTATQAIEADTDAAQATANDPAAATATPRLELAVTCADLTWMRIEIDGKPSREAFFPAGSNLTWNAGERISLLIGNTDGVSLTLNGEPATAASTGGKVGLLQIP